MRLAAVLAAIDDANACDPNSEQDAEGPQPAALLYGRRMSAILADFCPSASDELQIAVRGQHIERWKRRREDYPEGRAGYLRWRTDAARYHAGRVAALMRNAGYTDAACDRVAVLMLKNKLTSDPEAQVLEDVACLVFFRWHARSFCDKRTMAGVLPIVSKTARKMSSAGRIAALAFDLPEPVALAISAAG